MIRRAASLNCESIVLPLSQVEIPAKKGKHLIKISVITNYVKQDNYNSQESLPIQKF